MSVFRAHGLDLAVEGGLAITRDEERGVHDHLVADGLVRARGDGHIAQRLEDLADVALGARLQRALLRMKSGDIAGTKDDLEVLIEQKPDDLDMDKVRMLYRKL